MTAPIKVRFNYAEHQALIWLRKSMRDPARAEAIARSLLKDQSKELAYSVLKQLSKEMNDLLAINRAFQTVAATLAKQFPNEPRESK